MANYIRTKPEPYCPQCSAKMILRRPKPYQDWSPFWGCQKYPECKGTRLVKEVNEDRLPLFEFDDDD